MGKITSVFRKSATGVQSTTMEPNFALTSKGSGPLNGPLRSNKSVNPWTTRGVEKQSDVSVSEDKKPVFNSALIDKNMICYLNPRSYEAEMFRILRENILFPFSGNPPRLILITSVNPGEGKSFVASNLSISIAQNMNSHVVLLDCDLRRPCIHSRFGYSDVPGLKEHLSRGRSIASLLLNTMVDKLTILPAGKLPTNPAELITSKKMMALLEEMKSRYTDRYIIMDAPPPNFSSETNAIARVVDGIILVVKYGVTPREMILNMVEKIEKNKFLGTVINWFDLRSTSQYGYGTYRKYYHSYKAQRSQKIK